MLRYGRSPTISPPSVSTRFCISRSPSPSSPRSWEALASLFRPRRRATHGFSRRPLPRAYRPFIGPTMKVGKGSIVWKNPQNDRSRKSRFHASNLICTD